MPGPHATLLPGLLTGIVEHAVLLGTPVGTDGPRWTMARQVCLLTAGAR